MSNTQRPKAAMNGAGTAKRPGQIEILSMIAGGIQALAQDATRKPPAQRWQCAVCLGLMKAWELRHQDDLQQIVAQYQRRITAWTEFFNDPATPEEQKQAMLADQPNVQAMCAQYGLETGDPLPTVNEANALATLPELGTCGVCAGHLPPAQVSDVNRPRLLIAQGALSSALIAQVRGGQ